jgi:hypothetical protein
VGYWWPPPPSVFNPAPRPLSWHGDRIPDEEDALFFGYGVAEGNISLAWSPWTAHLARGGVAGAWNPGSARPFLKSKRGFDDSDILAAYSRLIDTRAPDDPPRGGLAPDYVDPDGTIHLQYYDLSDDRPIRKEVTYRPKSGGVDVSVRQYTPGKGWEGEGFDFERDFTTSEGPILSAINVVTTAIVSIFGTPAVGAAWSAAFGAGIQLSQAELAGTLTLSDALAQSFGALGAVIVQSGAGAALASDALPKLSSFVYRGLGITEKSSKDFAEALSKFGDAAGEALPKLKGISIEDVFAGAIPKEIASADAAAAAGLGANATEIPGSLSYGWKIASAAFAALKAGDLDRFYSWRKIASDPSLVDSSIACLMASDAAEEKSRELQASSFLASRDASATMTFRSALANARQASSFSKDDAARTFKQVALSMGLPETHLAPAKGFPWKFAIGAGVLLYIFRDRIFP